MIIFHFITKVFLSLINQQSFYWKLHVTGNKNTLYKEKNLAFSIKKKSSWNLVKHSWYLLEVPTTTITEIKKFKVEVMFKIWQQNSNQRSQGGVLPLFIPKIQKVFLTSITELNKQPFLFLDTTVLCPFKYYNGCAEVCG